LLTVAADNVRLRGITGSVFTLTTPVGRADVTTTLPGLYNVYNVVAAATAALTLGTTLGLVRTVVRDFIPAFGRGEQITIDGHTVYMLLAKNPVGFNEVLRTVLSGARPVVTVIAINDLTADGRDISWLWDVDFELLARRCRAAVVTGIRAHDMLLRLKYAGLPSQALNLEPDEARAIRRGVDLLAPGEPLYVLPTYTAMLRIRDLLARRGYVRAFWED